MNESYKRYLENSEKQKNIGCYNISTLKLYHAIKSLKDFDIIHNLIKEIDTELGNIKEENRKMKYKTNREKLMEVVRSLDEYETYQE